MADRYKARRARNRHRPWEFKKKLAAWAAAVATASTAASFILAAMDKNPVSDLSKVIFTACIGYLISYAAASATEKVSRNRHGLDADGFPLASEQEDKK